MEIQENCIDKIEMINLVLGHQLVKKQGHTLLFWVDLSFSRESKFEPQGEGKV